MNRFATRYLSNINGLTVRVADALYNNELLENISGLKRQNALNLRFQPTANARRV
jgi:hypothetical protein